MRWLLLYVSVFIAGCNSSAQIYREINADTFEKTMQNEIVQLLDVRTAAEFRTGHIKSALQANWNNEEEFKERTNALDKQKPVYVYCLSGPRSHAAAEWLLKNGFTMVVELKGGIKNWKMQGKPVESTVRIKQMTEQEYQQQITGKSYVLVDFGADWCPPCKKMEPVINSFAKRNTEVFLFKIDGGIHTDLMKTMNIESLPTFILLKNGKEVWRNSGLLTSIELESAWNSKK
jgi:rhodanese-related sulfurtransferase